MAFTESNVNFLNDCDAVFEEKKKQNREMNNFIKTISENLNISKDDLRRYKDYYHYRGRGWGVREDGTEDPLIAVKGVKFKDRVAPCFIKLLEIIKTLSIFGDYEFLEPYLNSLKEYGVDIKINIPTLEHKEEYNDYLACVDVYQTNICSLADVLNEEKKPEAELNQIVTKETFNKAIKVYNKLEHDKEIKDDLQNIALKSLLDSNFVENIINHFGTEIEDLSK